MDENYNDYNGAIDPASILAFLAILGFIVLISIVANWRIFQKAGKPGWASLIPIYNLYTFIKLVGKPGWWMLLLFVPFVNIYIAIKLAHLLSKSFGKDVGFTLGLIFLSFIFYPVLAFGGAKYVGPYGDPAAFAAYQDQNRFEFEKANV